VRIPTPEGPPLAKPSIGGGAGSGSFGGEGAEVKVAVQARRAAHPAV